MKAVLFLLKGFSFILCLHSEFLTQTPDVRLFSLHTSILTACALPSARVAPRSQEDLLLRLSSLLERMQQRKQMSRQLYKVSYKKGFRAFVMTYLECTTNILPPCPPYSGNAAHSLLVVSISYYINLLKIHLIYSDHSLPFSIDSKILPPCHPSNSGLSCFSLSLKNQTGKLKKNKTENRIKKE